MKLPADFDAVLRALLRTPPPPPGTPGSRKATLPNRWRNLKRAFDKAHQAGMTGLRTGDYAALAKAIRRERTIIRKQAALISNSRATWEKAKRTRKQLSGKKSRKKRQSSA